VTVATAPRIVVVDDDESNRRLMMRALVRDGYVATMAATAAVAMELIFRDPPDLVLLAVTIGGLNGFDVCTRIKADSATRLIPVILLTGSDAREDRIRGFRVGADDCMSKPVDMSELRARVASLLQMKHFTDGLDSAQSVMLSLAMTIEGRDPYTGGHCQRVARYATALGAALKVDGRDMETLHRGGFLHDIGKIAIPDAILLKNGPLTGAERSVIRQHPVVGDQLCRELRSLQDVRAVVRSHHERWDGSGYPDGLAGDEIPMTAQIVSVADAYDALTTERPYRPALIHEAAMELLRREAACGWRRRGLVELFSRTLKVDDPPD
jgi:putative two-component system response regulator